MGPPHSRRGPRDAEGDGALVQGCLTWLRHPVFGESPFESAYRYRKVDKAPKFAGLAILDP